MRRGDIWARTPRRVPARPAPTPPAPSAPPDRHAHHAGRRAPPPPGPTSAATTPARTPPASPRRILLRMCSNLHHVYQRNGMKEDATRLQGYIVALSK